MVHEATMVFAWDVPEFHYKEKRVDWYWWLGAITLGAILVTIFLWHNYIFAIFLFLAGILLMFQGRQQPGTRSIQLSEQGIKYGDKLIPYEDMSFFWIEAGTEAKPARLLFHSEKGRQAFDPIAIPNEINIVDLRDFLLEVMEEREMHESLLQKLLHRMGM